jgi:exodeoxyribonuclease V alpha subunit
VVVIISEAKALRMAVKRQQSQRRITQLGERLRKGAAAQSERSDRSPE